MLLFIFGTPIIGDWLLNVLIWFIFCGLLWLWLMFILFILLGLMFILMCWCGMKLWCCVCMPSLL